MINALRISIGDITYENVKVLLSTEIEEMGFEPIFEEHTLMFRQGIRWHACHDWNLKIIHVSRGRLRFPHLIPFERIVIDSNKIYGPGMFATNQVLVEYGVDEIWHHRLERQIAFSCPDGILISTDYAIDNLILKPGITPHARTAAANIAARSIGGPDTKYIRRGEGTKPCRSC